MTRSRLAKNKDLAGLNLYPAKVGSRVYYRFRDPQTRKFFSLGSDKTKAIKAAKALMARRAPDVVERLVRKVTGERKLCAKVIQSFDDDDLTTRVNKHGAPLSTATLRDYRQMLKRTEGWFGDMEFAAIGRADLAVRLDDLPGRQANAFRTLWVQLWRYAIGKGWADVNVAEQTLTQNAAKQRTRLTMEDFDAIRGKADPWLRAAMDLALYSIQRREDLARMQASAWDDKAGTLSVVQSKTKASLLIQAGPELKAAIERCLGRPPVDAPTLLRLDRAAEKTRNKHSHITPDYLTDEFATARDSLTKFAKMPAPARPTLHELRSLGAAQYLWKCRNIDEVQKLLGHKTRQQTLDYLRGHPLPPEAVNSG